MRTLLVEGDYSTRKLMNRCFSQYGEVDVTEDGEEAVDAFIMAMEEEESYDVICLDILMPVMDGFEVLKAIRSIETEKGIEKKNRVKVIMIADSTEKENLERAFELGCDAYSGKPIDLKKLEGMLEKFGLI